MRIKCERFLLKHQMRNWVLNDESYFTKYHLTIHHHQTLFTPAIVKFRRTHKFNEKRLVRVALYFREISEPFIMPSGNNAYRWAKQFIYRNNCLAPRLLPFIKNIILMKIKSFGCSRRTTLMPKADNPTNLSNARSIEDFWGQ